MNCGRDSRPVESFTRAAIEMQKKVAYVLISFSYVRFCICFIFERSAFVLFLCDDVLNLSQYIRCGLSFFPLSHPHTHTLTRTLSHTLSHTHTHTFSLSPTHTHSFSRTHSPLPTRPLSPSLSHKHPHHLSPTADYYVSFLWHPWLGS